MAPITNEMRESLSDVFAEAAQLAGKVPEHLQQSAFVKALDYLMGAPIEPQKIAQNVAQLQDRTRKKEPIRPQKKSGRPGPKAAIAELAQTDFLLSGKTVTEIQQYLKKKRGHEYGANELSISVVRLVRDGILEREQNENGQYVYTAVRKEQVNGEQ